MTRMTLALKKVEREGTVPPGFEIIWLSCCEQCLFWERGVYQVTGTCRRYPYPRMHAWQRCPHWSNRHRRPSVLERPHPSAGI